MTYGSLALAVGLLLWTVHATGWDMLLARLTQLGPWLFAVVALEVVITSLDAAAIRALVHPDEARIGLGRVFVAQVAGRAVNVLTPLGALGEVAKAAMLMERVAPARAVTAVLLFDAIGLEISLIVVGLGAPLCAGYLDLPVGLRVALAVAGALSAAAAVALPWVIRHRALTHVVDAARRLRVLPTGVHRRWRAHATKVDAQLESGGQGSHGWGGARARAIGLMLVERLVTWATTAVLVHAAGGPLSVGFLAAMFTAGQVIAWASSLVPLGLGVAEGGNYALFSALGVAPAIGVAVTLGRRVTHVLYAAVGVVLVSVDRTVRDAFSARRSRRRDAGSSPAATPPTPAARSR